MSLFVDAVRNGQDLYGGMIPPTPIARTTDPATSHEAAATVTKLGDKQTAVLCIHRDNPAGITDEQLIEQYREAIDLDPAVPDQTDSGIRTRRAELVKLGWLEDTGRKGLTASGRGTIIWGLTARARR